MKNCTELHPREHAARCNLLDELEDCRLENLENTAGQMLGKAIDWIQSERSSIPARDVLIEVRDWDCLGGSVQEHYDEMRGAGAYDRTLSAPADTGAQDTLDAVDAARYRWLRSRAHKGTAYDRYGDGAHWSIGFHSEDGRQDFDAAIDASMAATKEQT